MPHLVVFLKGNYERSYTVITRFVSSVTEMLLPDNCELHLRIQKFPQLYRSGTGVRINDSKKNFLLWYAIAMLTYLLAGSSSAEPPVKFQYAGRNFSVQGGGRYGKG